MTEHKPVTPTEAALVLIYLLIALSRQVTRDVRTIWRWVSSTP